MASSAVGVGLQNLSSGAVISNAYFVNDSSNFGWNVTASYGGRFDHSAAFDNGAAFNNGAAFDNGTTFDGASNGTNYDGYGWNASASTDNAILGDAFNNSFINNTHSILHGDWIDNDLKRNVALAFVIIIIIIAISGERKRERK